MILKIKKSFRLAKRFIVSLLFYFLLFANKNIIAQNISGKWKLDLDLPSIGMMQILLDFTQTSDTSFVASSRPKVLKNIMGGIKYYLAITNKKFKNGAIIHIYNGKIIGDSLIGTLTTSTSNFDFSIRLKNGIMTGYVYATNKERNAFTIKATPFNKDFIDYDYSGLVKEIKNSFVTNIYDKELLNANEWKNFYKELDAVTTKVHDDLEMFLYFNFLIRDIKLSHISISKYNTGGIVAKTDSTETTPRVVEEFINDKVGYLKYFGFQMADTIFVRNFFRKIISEKKPYLILDFRGCGGGDQSSMHLASYLTTEVLNAGFFIGNKYYHDKRELPTIAEIDKLPVYSAQSVKDLLDYITVNGLLKGNVIPDSELHYTGKVYVLIDKKSASATEPISYLLKQHNLATLIGETTAGKMLSSKVFRLKDNWSLLIPIADYYTADQFRIEQNGVTPNIKINPKEALDYILKILK